MLEDRDAWIDSPMPETIKPLYEAIVGLPEEAHSYFLPDATFTWVRRPIARPNGTYLSLFGIGWSHKCLT